MFSFTNGDSLNLCGKSLTPRFVLAWPENMEPNGMRTKINFSQWTSSGDRTINQDFMAHIIEKNWLYCVVADGLGGHQGGEKASCYFCESLVNGAHDFVSNMKEPRRSFFGETSSPDFSSRAHQGSGRNSDTKIAPDKRRTRKRAWKRT